MTKKWTAANWLKWEIFDVMSTYENTREEAIDHVKSMLESDEYRDELTDKQVAAVLAKLRKL